MGNSWQRKPASVCPGSCPTGSLEGTRSPQQKELDKYLRGCSGDKGPQCTTRNEEANPRAGGGGGQGPGNPGAHVSVQEESTQL